MRKDHIKNGIECLIEGSFIPYFKDLLTETNPQLIIEFGMNKGGLTQYFLEWLPETYVIGVEKYWLISEENRSELLKKKISILITGNLFKNEPILPLILSLPVKKFLFCDNGFRKSEILTYSGYLKPGDLLGVHDWGEELTFKDVEKVLVNFEDHEINKKIDDNPGLSCCRFWIKNSMEESDATKVVWDNRNLKESA